MVLTLVIAGDLVGDRELGVFDLSEEEVFAVVPLHVEFALGGAGDGGVDGNGAVGVGIPMGDMDVDEGVVFEGDRLLGAGSVIVG